MASGPIRSIPESVITGLSKVATLTEEQFQELYTGLENIPLRILQPRIYDDSGIELKTLSRDAVDSISNALFPLFGGRASSSVSPTTYANNLAEALKDESHDDIEWLRSDKTFSRFKERLIRLLSIDRVELIAKTYDLLTAHARTFIKARIISDIRPVFGESTETTPQTAIITHMLNITYHKDHDRREFVVALDTRDIQKLIDTLERAKAKTETLKSVIASTDMEYVEVV